MTKEQKIKEIKKLTRQQASLMKESLRVATLPTPKRWMTSYNRACKIIAIAFKVRSIEMQKRLIMATQTPKIKPGGVMPKGVAIVGENLKEEIIIKP